MALKTNRGVEQLEKHFAAAAGSPRGKSGIPEATEVMDVLRDALDGVTSAYGTAQMAKVVKEIVNPEKDTPDALETIIKAKQAGLIGGENDGSFGATAQLLGTMLQEQGKQTSEARNESKQLTESLLTMMMGNMQDQNQSAMGEILKRLDNEQTDPFQSAVKQAMAAMLMNNLRDVVNPKQQAQAQEKGRSMSDLVKELGEMEQVYTHLSSFFKRREDSLGELHPGQMRSQWMNPEILRATLEDDRERIRMQMEQEKIKDESRARKETMDKAESIISQIAPLIAQSISRQGAASQMHPQEAPQEVPQHQPMQENEDGPIII